MLVRHHNGAGNTHADCPAADNDFILVLHRPLLGLVLHRQTLPVQLFLGLDTLNLLHTGARPCRFVEFDTTSLSLNGVEGEDDDDGGKRLELDGEFAEGGPLAVEVKACGNGDGETGGGTLESAADCGSVVAFKLFLSGELNIGMLASEQTCCCSQYVPSCCCSWWLVRAEEWYISGGNSS